jgi:hypothetical protein
MSCRNNIHVYIQIFERNKLCTTFYKFKLYTNINYVQEINEFKVQRIGFRGYDTIDVPWTSDDFVEEELEELTIYW